MDHVFIMGRRKEALDAAIAEIGRNTTAIQGDVDGRPGRDRQSRLIPRFDEASYVSGVELFVDGGVAQI